MLEVSQIASVLDVLKVYAEGFVGSSQSLAVLSTLLKKPRLEYVFSDDAAAALAASIRVLRQRIETLGLPMSAKQLGAIADCLDGYAPADNDELQRLIDDGLARLSDELALRQCYMLDASVAALYSEERPFGDPAWDRFASARQDVQEAAKCLALDQGTACVFHLMRVLESALQEFGTHVGLTHMEKNWQELINNVNGAIKKLPRTTESEKAFLGKASEIAAHLQHVKDAWRNDVMHPRASYSPLEARDVWQHAKALTVKIALFV
jgi:hypothetical protein